MSCPQGFPSLQNLTFLVQLFLNNMVLGVSISVPANLALTTLALCIELSLLLLSPVAPLLVVFAYSKCSSQLFTLFNLRRCKLVNLMRLQALRTWSTARLALLAFQLSSQSIASVVNLVFVNTMKVQVNIRFASK